MQEVWENIRNHRVQVVQELRVDRTLLFDYLRSKDVLDSEDCELVKAEKTNERKASRLLDILQTKNTESLVYFLHVLQLLNPGLYEKLTGQKATRRESQIINEVSDQSFTDLDPQRDFDIFSSHSKRAVADLQEMTLRYDQLLKEKQWLNKSLSEVTRDRDLKFKHLQTAEDQAVRADERASEALNNARKMEETANFHKKEYEKAISDKYAWFLVMMSSVEETKQLRKQVDEERRRNEELLCKLQELSQNFDYERNHSQKLSERLLHQRSSVKSAEDLKDQYRELQFILQKVQMEKDQAISELNELKNWAEALKTHYDIVEKNKPQCQESYDNAVVDCSQFKRKIQDLQFQLALLQRQGSNYKAENDELTQLVKKYQEQRDFYGEEITKDISERDEARRERDEMYQQFSDTQKEKDQALQRFLLETGEKEITIAEMRALKKCLVQTKEKLRSLQLESELSLNIRQSTMTRDNTTVKSFHTADDDDDDDDNVFGNRIEAVQGKNSRKCTELINSIKRRFYNSYSSVLPLEIPGTDEEMCFAQWLSCLPCQALIRMLYHTPVKSRRSGEISAAANAFNFDLLPSANSPMTDDFSDVEILQELTVNDQCTDEWKEEMASNICIFLDLRPRAYALDRYRNPRDFYLDTPL